MKKRTFLINTVFLTASALLLRTIGVSFRVYMSNKIGAGGMGLYQLILTIYMLAVTFVSSGIILAVTRLITDAIARNEKEKVKIIMYISFAVSGFLGILSGGILFFSADLIGNSILNDPRAILLLKILAPSLPFLAVSACCRGYFFAVRKVVYTASEQILEQIVEIAVFAGLILYFAPKGIEYACAAILIGTALAEIISSFYSYVLYKIHLKKVINKNHKKIRRKNIFKEIIKIAAPVTGSSCLRTGLSTIENILIPKGLKKNGQTYDNALSGYGMLTAMVMPVLSFPSAFLASFSMLLIPELSEANAIGHKKNIKYISGRVFQVTFLFSMLIMGIFLFFGKSLSMLIYNDTAPGIYICILAPIIPLMYLDSVVDGMLKGLNEQLYHLSYNIIDSVVRVVLIFVLIPIYGLKGLIIVIFVSEILESSLSIARLMKVTELKMQFVKWILKPIIAIAVPGVLLFLFKSNIDVLIPNLLMRMILQIAFTCIVYFGLLFIIKGVKNDDILWIKGLIKQNYS